MRGNPAFDSGGSETAGESETTLATESGEEESGTVAECEYDEGQALRITLPYPCLPNIEATQRYEWYFKVTAETPNGWEGGLCPVGCDGECPANPPQEVELGPFAVAGLATVDDCLLIKAVQVDPSAPENCDFDAVGIWLGDVPIVMASKGTALIGEALADAGQINPETALAEDPRCECVEECCVVSPGDYEFQIEGQSFLAGDGATLIEAFPDYSFHPLSAFNPTGCAGDLHTEWAITLGP